ncbi:MAG: hypothetical protein LBK62_12375 [Treponema sp.]|nr:hypothetical protein [Treponema sp.]
MRITVNLNLKVLIFPNLQSYLISNCIRSLRDGTRKFDEVVRTIPGDFPYDPQYFPKGLWKITGVEWQKDKGFDSRIYGPVKIRTDAWQWVKVWQLDEDGDYLKETAQLVRDTGYLLHYSDSKTTWGCIRLASPDDATAIGKAIENALIREEVLLEVV